MIYNNLNRTGQIEEIKTKNDKEIVEVYGGIGENNPIYYKETTMEGVAPLSFKALGQPLTNWTIYGYTSPIGAVGDRTVNIMPSASETTITSHGITVTCDGKGKYYISGTNDSNDWVYFFFNLKENFTIPVAASSGGQGTLSFWNSTASANVIGFFNGSKTIDTWSLNTINRRVKSYGTMGGKICNRISINITAGYSGNFVLSPNFTENGKYSSIFEPYGYKIPVTCDGETTNIYLDFPLYEGDSISFSTAQTTIPTTVGQNTLSIGTTVQPSKVSIEGNIKT